MYEQSAKWNEYYRELEPENRLRLLEVLLMTQPDDGANEYRKRLYDQRYLDEKNPGKPVDRFLFQCVNLPQVYRSAAIFHRSAKKETQKVLRDLFLMQEAMACGEAGERALYWELRNAAARYFESCQNPAYHRALFGFMASGDASRKENMCKDAWEMTEGLANRVSLTEELRVWNRAVQDSYFMSDPEAERRFWEYHRARAGKT